MTHPTLEKLYSARSKEKKCTFEVLKYLKLVDEKKLYVDAGSSDLY